MAERHDSQAGGPADWRPVPGDWVRVRGVGGVGQVLELDWTRRRARVAFGDHEWIIKPRDLKPAEAPEPPRQAPVKVIGAGPTYHQIDLHGLRVEEALVLAERAVDQAVAGHLDKVKIIHGHGTGALRKAIREMLARHPHVAEFRFGSPMEGGLACTIAELKK